jgi:hypothetical protein
MQQMQCSARTCCPRVSGPLQLSCTVCFTAEGVQGAGVCSARVCGYKDLIGSQDVLPKGERATAVWLYVLSCCLACMLHG